MMSALVAILEQLAELFDFYRFGYEAADANCLAPVALLIILAVGGRRSRTGAGSPQQGFPQPVAYQQQPTFGELTNNYEDYPPDFLPSAASTLARGAWSCVRPDRAMLAI